MLLAKNADVIELFSGTCRLVLSDRVESLRCVIRLFQDCDGDCPTSKRIDGKFENLPRFGAAFAMMEDRPLDLILEDGRRAAIRLTADLHGNFLDGNFKVLDLPINSSWWRDSA
jgi:hypothetical protein